MTEDGRSTGMAALRGRGLNLLRGWGKRDAQLDAHKDSLWPDTVAGFVLRTKQKQVLRFLHPADQDLSVGTPCAQDYKPSSFQLCIFRGDFS
jgi:hypothetical protein